MKTLAIHGHPTKGKKILEILEMLGGKNISDIKGNHSYLYYIDDNNFISLTDSYRAEFIIFTIEEFLEKYPYKVGDKVLLNNQVKVVKGIGWDSNNDEVIYTLETNINGVKTQYQVFNYDLRPYEEEIKEEDNTNIHINPDIDNKTTCDIKINGMKVNINDYTVKSITKTDDGLIVEYIKNKQYPKTYEECEKVLRYDSHRLDDMGVTVKGYKWELIRAFQILLICRDAYWKISGEEMGLSESWKPDYTSTNRLEMHFIYCTSNEISYGQAIYPTNKILIFPTRELRDIFLENFKNLIEKCKEFL